MSADAILLSILSVVCSSKNANNAAIVKRHVLVTLISCSCQTDRTTCRQFCKALVSAYMVTFISSSCQTDRTA
jgi:hypothetical protein